MCPTEKDSSPRSTGPAGGQFETKVGTHYALALLANTEPLGLPGAVVSRLEFQRGGQGHPLDDVIVRGTTPQGEERCLEVQVKRSMAFTENDANFQSVVDGIVRARKIQQDRRFAVAIERTTGVIENGVQEVLELAQQTIDTESFLKLLETPGRGNKDMRAFVTALRALLAAKDVTGDDVLYDILRSFSVLTFDYARPNSMAEYHDRLRARHLASEKSGVALYDSLFGLILRADAIGGELDREELVLKLNDLGVSIGAVPGLAVARRHIEELSRHALQDIGITIKDCRLAREKSRRELEGLLRAAETQGGVVEISGPSGAGKSGLLRSAIEAREAVSRILVLAPDRTPSGGWPAMRAIFGIEATADELLSDLACDGGAYLCIDGLDRFRDSAQQKTVIDLLRAALSCSGMTVLFTAQPGWEDEGALWIGEEVFSRLSARGRMFVEGLDDDEAEALAKAAPQLAPLLRPDHPAKLLSRNLLKLRMLVSTRLNKTEAISEAALAIDWQASGAAGTGKRTSGEIHSRKRVLNAVANDLIDNAGLVDVSGQDAQAVAELIAEEVLVEIHPDRVRFRHDLFSDWAIACILFDDPDVIDRLGLDAPPPFWMARGFELACRMIAECSKDEAWPKLLAHLETEGGVPGWAGLALLALVRSERADELLVRYDAFLLEDEGRRAARLLRRFVASHTQSVAPLFKEILPEEVAVPEGMTIPKGPEWTRLILWCLKRFGQLGATALSAAVDLFQKWLVLAAFGEKTIAPILLDRYADILVAAIEHRDRPLPRYGEPLPKIKYAVTNDARDTARLYLALFAMTSPGAAARYLNAVKDSKRPEEAMNQILKSPGRLPGAAPAEFVAAFLRTLEDDEEEDEFHRKPARRSYAMSRVNGPFVLGQCGIGVFTEILQAAPSTGVAFIRTLTERACAVEDGYPEFSVQFLGKTHRIEAMFSYGWSRGRAPSAMLAKALSAMEHWAHRRLDGGETLDAVIGDIMADGPIFGAFWLLIVDLVLSHSSLNGALLRDILVSPETLALDTGRANIDTVDRMSGGVLGSGWRTGLAADQAVEKDLADRGSRFIALHNVIPQLVFNLSREELCALRSQFEAAVSRLGPWIDDAVDWASPQFMAAHALRLVSRDNYELVTEKDTAGEEHEGWIYKWPPGQKKWLEERAAKANAEQLTFTRSLAVRAAMNDETKTFNVSAADAEAILDETVTAAPGEEEPSHDPNDPWLTRVSAAAFLARVGHQEEVMRRRQEINSIFEQALQFQDRSRTSPRDDVMYDAHAIAIAGRLYLAAASGDEEDVEDLLQVVATYPASAAPAFLRHGGAAEKIDQKLLISLSRIALLACMIPRRAHYGEDEAAYDKRRADLESLLASRIEAEWQWRKGGAEPDWPLPPPRRSRRRKRPLMIGGAGGAGKRTSRESEWPDYYYDERTGTAWLRILTRLGPSAGSTSRAVMRANRDWLLETNRSGEAGEDESDIERVWTRGLMDYAAAHARQWPDEMCQELVIDVLKAFSDEAFIDAAAAFIVQSDLRHIEGDTADRAYLLSVREAFWPRLKETWHWRNHLRSSRDGRMEIHLKELVSAFYMRLSYGFGNGQSYTKGLSDAELTLFLPLLSEIAGEAPSCPTIAHLYLNVLECLDPSTAEGPLAVTAECWVKEANNRFWNELGVGNRVLTIGQKAVVLSDISAWNAVCEALMAAGVTVETEFLERLYKEANQ